MTAAVRILVADDHRIVREGIVRILDESPDCKVVAEAADGVEAVERALEVKPDVVVMDLTMPRLGGLDAVRRIHAQLPQVRILILTVHEDEEYIVPIIKAGASGYLVKDSASTELTEAIATIAAGGVCFGPQATKILAEQYQRPTQLAEDPYGNLTDREREVFHLVVEGKTNKQIANVMGIALKTANNHRTNMMNKLDLHNTADIVRYAARKGLLPDAT
ncbi:MAG: response regulator transcription factor [Gammaproteobacteria bacterium]|nr:response regulator transcription factor [Gammaproteobacteria bacterium]MBU2676241.1 response regulator transcription factor [Gammaproteobacteria bacterium]NNC56651.1 response regulator transcription factor [Woeseiaceae bacterium]NNL49976.1 response regulator transcription factor [Woeseiaceae bacterium]